MEKLAARQIAQRARKTPRVLTATQRDRDFAQVKTMASLRTNHQQA
jgi:Holliday junction resolvasome RuvABC ATP-dependent DNA helicase subunit